MLYAEAIKTAFPTGIRNYIISGLLLSGLCPSSGMLMNATFQKMDLLPSSEVKVGGIYSVGSVLQSARRWTTSKSLAIPNVIHLRHEPLRVESTSKLSAKQRAIFFSKRTGAKLSNFWFHGVKIFGDHSLFLA